MWCKMKNGTGYHTQRPSHEINTQMAASAKQMAELEEQLIHEQLRVESLKSRVERESERRQATSDELASTRKVLRNARNPTQSTEVHDPRHP